MFPPTDELEIGVEDVSRLLQLPENEQLALRLVDCREEDEFALCRITSATLLPLSTFAERAPIALPARHRPVIVYCHHGMRSQQAALYLRNRGYEKVWSMRGGIEAWSTEIDPAVPRY